MKYTILLLTLSVASLSALNMGNPAETQIIDEGFWIPQDCTFGAKLGYLGDRVADRKLKASGQGHIDRTKLSFDQAVVVFNFLDRVELYGSGGSVHGSVTNRPHSDTARRKYQTQEGWTAGCGGRILLAQWGKAVIGIDGKVQWGNPVIKWMSIDGVSANTTGHLKYCEWQASFAVSYTVDWLTPYLGVKYSNVHAQISGIPREVYHHPSFKMINRDRFGLALGATLSPGKKFDIFAEVQLIDEQSLSFGGSLRF